MVGRATVAALKDDDDNEDPDGPAMAADDADAGPCLRRLSDGISMLMNT